MTRTTGDWSRTASHQSVPGADGGHGSGLAVGVLGPLELAINGQPIEVKTGRLRALLAMSADRTVTVDQLAAAVWGEQLPGNARRSVQTYVTRLRSLLGSDTIGTRPAAYALAV
jgi:DNA-binding SARP family transcriptional activator